MTRALNINRNVSPTMSHDIIKKSFTSSSASSCSTSSAVPPPTQHQANADTGTTGHYIALKDINCLHNVCPTTKESAITVVLPTGEEIKSTHTGELQFSPDHDKQKVHMYSSHCGVPYSGLESSATLAYMLSSTKPRYTLSTPNHKLSYLLGIEIQLQGYG